MKFRKLSIAALLFGSLFLTACHDKQDSTSTLKLGVIAGAELELAELAKDIAKKDYNLDVEIVTFFDFVTPNEALSKGDIDINAMQHKPYLDQQIKERHYQFAIVGNTFIYPLAAYSAKIKSLAELKDGAQIAIPNDLTNLARSLLLMQKQGLIKVDPSKGLLPTLLDITDNPHHFKIIEIDAAQLPRILNDPQVDLAIINSTFATQISLKPTTDSLFIEDKDSPYVNIIVARDDNKDDEKVKTFVKAFQDDRIVAKAEQVFNGGAVKGW